MSNPFGKMRDVLFGTSQERGNAKEMEQLGQLQTAFARKYQGRTPYDVFEDVMARKYRKGEVLDLEKGYTPEQVGKVKDALRVIETELAVSEKQDPTSFIAPGTELPLSGRDQTASDDSSDVRPRDWEDHKQGHDNRW